MTRKTMFTVASVLALSLAAGAVQAQDAAPKAPEGPRGGFAAMDFNQDGKITAEDFTARKLAMQKAMDPDGDGFITLEEMKTQAGERAKQRAEERAERRFKALDTDGDGKISAAEALMDDKNARRAPGPEAFVARFDADKDGAVSPEEFEAARKAMHERGPGKRFGAHGRGEHGPGRGHHGKGHHERGHHGKAPHGAPTGGVEGEAPATPAPAAPQN